MIRSTLRIGVVWTIVYLLGGWIAVGMYTVAFWMSKMMYEAIGYQFHQGQVCAPGEPDGDRHSWNCNRLMSQVVLFNVSKHSEHHKHPNRPFHELAKVKQRAIDSKYLGRIYTGTMIPLEHHSSSDWTYFGIFQKRKLHHVLRVPARYFTNCSETFYMNQSFGT